MKKFASKSYFEEYYKKRDVVSRYDAKRTTSLKQRVIRTLEQASIVPYLRANSRILEAGVGTGHMTKVLMRYGDVTGIDTSTVMLNQARKNVDESVKLQVASILDIPFVSGDFDTAVTFRVLMHFDEKTVVRALEQLSSSIRPGGRVIFDIPACSIIKRLAYIFKVHVLGHKDVYNYQYSRFRIHKMAKRAGLTVERLRALDHLALTIPIYFLARLAPTNWAQKKIERLESACFSLGAFNTRWVVICKKKK